MTGRSTTVPPNGQSIDEDGALCSRNSHHKGNDSMPNMDSKNATPSPELLRLLDAIQRVPARDLVAGLELLDGILNIHLRRGGANFLLEGDTLMPPEMRRSRRGRAFLTLWNTFHGATVSEAVGVMRELRVAVEAPMERIGVPRDMIRKLRSSGPQLPSPKAKTVGRTARGTSRRLSPAKRKRAGKS